MAYLGHGTVRETRTFGGAWSSDVLHVALKSALVAVVAGGAILAFTETGSITATLAPASKNDRLAAPLASSDVGGSFVTDPANRVTTIEKGASSPLNPQSPFAGGR